MGVRSFSNITNAGYGVSTKQLNETNADIEHSLQDILLNADLPSVVRRQERTGEMEPYRKLAISCVWKQTIIFAPVRADLLKVYDARMGKSRYASYVCGLDQYFVSDGFYSYSQQQSGLYGCSYVVSLPSFVDEEIPCNEPPVELSSPVVTGGEFWYPSVSLRIPISPTGTFVGGTANLIGANNIFVYFDKAVEGAISAITYTFAVEGYTEERLQSVDPIRLLF